MNNTIYTTFTSYTDTEVEQRKRVWLNEAGELCKDNSLQKGNYLGIAEKIRMPFSGLIDYINSADKKSFLMTGVFDGTGKKVLTTNYNSGGTVQLESQEYNVISRTKSDFAFPEKKLLSLIDIDFPSEAKLGYKKEGFEVPQTCKDVAVVLRETIKELQDVPLIIKPSSTAFLSVDGKEISGPRYHVYFPSKSRADFDYFNKVVFKRLFLAGLGWIQISKNGAALERTFIDQSLYKNVSQPIYLHRAKIDDARIQCEQIEAEYFDGDSYFEKGANWTPGDQKAYFDLSNEYKRNAEDKRVQVETQYCIKKLQSEGLECTSENIEAKRKELVRKRESCVLHKDDIIITKRYGQVTVREIIQNAGKFDQCICMDPSDYINENDYKAKVLVDRDGIIQINSFAHGGKVYRLKHYDKLTKLKDHEGTFGSDYIDKESAGTIMQEKVTDFFDFEQHNGTKTAITATPGFGKTHTTLESIIDAVISEYSKAEGDDISRLYVDYFFPTHKLGDELMNTWNTLVEKKLKSISGSSLKARLKSRLKAVWVKGRHTEIAGEVLCKHQIKTYWKDENDHKLIDSTFCKGFDGVNKGANLESLLIAECTHKDKCDYIAQRQTAENIESVVHFLPHDYLFTRFYNDKRIQKVTHVVIDEDIIEKKILNTQNNVHRVEREEQWETVGGIIDHCKNGGTVFEAIEGCRSKLIAEKKHLGKRLNGCYGDFLNLGRFDIKGYKAARQKTERKYNVLSTLLRYKEGHHNIWFDVVEKGGSIKTYHDTLHVGRKRDIGFEYAGKKTLILDGTGSKAILKAAYGNAVEIIELKIKQSEKVRAIQDYTENFSKRALLKGGKIDEVVKRLEKYKGQNIGIICWKDVNEILKKKCSWLSGDDFMHFGNLRGLDHFKKKDKEKVLVISRYMINEGALIMMARMLYHYHTNLSFDKGARRVFYRTNDGKVKQRVSSNEFLDSRMVELQKHINQAEMIQAFGRLRGVHAKSEKTLEFWSQAAVDFEFDEILEESLENGLDLAVQSAGVLAYWDNKALAEASGMSVRAVEKEKENSSEVFKVKKIKTNQLKSNGTRGAVYDGKKNACKKFLISNSAKKGDIDKGLLEIGKNGYKTLKMKKKRVSRTA